MSSDSVDDELLALHRRLLDGDRAVSSKLAPLLLPYLRRKAVKRHKDRLQKRLERLRDRLS